MSQASRSEIRSPAALFRTPVGAVVLLVACGLLVYSLIALGELLVGVVSVLLLIGGYVGFHLLFRLVVVCERLAGAAERIADRSSGSGDSSG